MRPFVKRTVLENAVSLYLHVDVQSVVLIHDSASSRDLFRGGDRDHPDAGSPSWY